MISAERNSYLSAAHITTEDSGKLKITASVLMEIADKLLSGETLLGDDYGLTKNELTDLAIILLDLASGKSVPIA